MITGLVSAITTDGIGSVAWRLVTSRVGILVIVGLAAFIWHTFDKRAAVRQAVEGLVAQAEYDAVQALLNEERRLRRASDRAAEAAKRLAAASSKTALEKTAELERLRAAAAKDSGLSKPTERDLEWLGSHP